MKNCLILSVILIINSSNLFAWGTLGHRIIGKIAESHLSKKAKIEVKKLLKHQTLAQVAEWADDIKYLKKWQHTRPWHYVNIKKGKTYKTSNKNAKGDVVEAIKRLKKDLLNNKLSKEKRIQTLKFLVHFIGDIHQPLHIAYKSDKGGNKIKIKWRKKETDLHKVWDYHLIRREKLSFTEYASFINHPTQKDILKWSTFDPELWVQEGRVYLEKIYELVTDKTLTSGKKIENRYAYRVMPIVNEQLLKAGVRLASLLNESFAK